MHTVVRKIGNSEGGYDVTADNGMVYRFVMAVAADAVGEDSAARWFRDFTELHP